MNVWKSGELSAASKWRGSASFEIWYSAKTKKPSWRKLVRVANVVVMSSALVVAQTQAAWAQVFGDTPTQSFVEGDYTYVEFGNFGSSDFPGEDLAHSVITNNVTGNCFSDFEYPLTNGTTISSNGTKLAFSTPTISASEASTTQLLEIAAQRRDSAMKTCPRGLALVDGQCVPERNTLQPTNVPVPRDGQPVDQQSVAGTGHFVPPTNGREYGAWVEGYYDYEERDSLPDGVSDTGRQQTVDRETETWGFSGGIDKTLKIGPNQQLLIGVMGGYKEVEQVFRSNAEATAIVNDEVEVRVNLAANQTLDPFDDSRFEITSLADFNIPNEHAFRSSVTQTINGQSIGGYGSLISGGFSIDLSFNTDFNTFERRITTFDTANSEIIAINGDTTQPLELDAVIVLGFGRTCVNVGTLDFIEGDLNLPQPKITDFVTLGNPTTNSEAETEQTDVNTYTIAANAQFRYDYQEDGYWIEPTVGVRFTFSISMTILRVCSILKTVSCSVYKVEYGLGARSL